MLDGGQLSPGRDQSVWVDRDHAQATMSSHCLAENSQPRPGSVCSRTSGNELLSARWNIIGMAQKSMMMHKLQ